MASLDDLDRRLLTELRIDGRAPATTLAKRLGVARATVNSRIERLTRQGTVLGFTVRVRDDHDADGVRAMTLIEVQGRSASEVIATLQGIPEIAALHTTNGGWDLVAELRTRDLGDFDRVLGEIRSIEGIRNSETSILLSSVLR